MARVTAELSMSLDGFVAHLDDSVDHLFDWYFEGDVEVVTANPDVIFHTSEGNARHIREAFERCGCLVSGRRLFDYTDGWNGVHPVGTPVVVVTHDNIPRAWISDHPGAPFSFVTGGIEGAVQVAKDIAGPKDVAVAGPNVIQQCINLRLIDEICVSLVPVLIGEGIPFFGHLKESPVRLAGPRIVDGEGVTHLYFSLKPA